jgi:ABC-2 type transport system ATP-binding protein
MDKEIAISVQKVSKSFRLPHEKNSSIKSGVVSLFKKKNRSIETQNALKNISFDVKKGEFFGILGRNGSGKSTLLKILAEIYQPSNGSTAINGKLVPFIELGVGFNPELTGRENVYLNGALLGFSRKEIDERYDDIVAFAELEDFMDQKLKNYSSGMQVRLAFSVATRADADILLVDEVLAVGDADFQRKCYNFFKSLKESGKTVIFVTHDMNAVGEYCDRAVLISDGIITKQGPARDVADEYLKLFNAVKDTAGVNGKDGRWGSGELRLAKHTVDIGDDITIKFKIKSTIDVDNVVFGYRLYGSNGELLVGASTLNALNTQAKLSFNKGESKTLSFVGKNILGSGDYRLGYTIRLGDMVTVFDDNENLLKFTHHKPEAYQPIIYPVKMTIEK